MKNCFTFTEELFHLYWRSAVPLLKKCYTFTEELLYHYWRTALHLLKNCFTFTEELLNIYELDEKSPSTLSIIEFVMCQLIEVRFLSLLLSLIQQGFPDHRAGLFKAT